MATDIHPSPENPRMSTLKLGEGGNRVRLRTCPIVLLKKVKRPSRFVAAKHTDLHLVKISALKVWLLEEVVDLVVLGHEEVPGAPYPA